MRWPVPCMWLSVRSTARKHDHALHLYDLDDIANLLGVSRKTVYRYCKSGRLPSNNIGGKVLVSERTLIAFLNGAKPQKSNTRTGKYAARGQDVEAPKFDEFEPDDLTDLQGIEED